MDFQVHPGSPMEPDPPWADPVLLGGETQLDFFRKLGYSAVQVRGAMQKVGGADTDRVLGELVRAGAGPESGPCRGGPEPGSRGWPGPEPETRGARGPGRPGTPEDFRPVVIDGSNVAMSHGNKEVFSCLGIQLAVRFFQDRGHADIIVFVPSWRTEPSRPDVPISRWVPVPDQHLLRELERERVLVFTPSRRVGGRRVVCYDDRFIVKEAFESGGVILSNDTYRDLQAENPEWRRLIQENLLMYFFISDKFVVPDDPLGRHGPTLDNFLRRVPKVAKKHPCPYGRKCTYGIKCKFHHPARGPQSNLALADELREKGKPPSPHHRPGSGSPGGSGTSGSTQYLSLAEEMSQKLSLHHQQHSSTSRKGPMSQNLVVRGHTSRKHPSKKEKAHQPSPGDREPLRSTGSQVQLDSGLGSIENQTMDSGEHGGCRYSQGPQYYPASAPACSCCSHAAPSLANPAGAAQHQHHPHPHLHPQHHPPPPPPGQHPSLGPPAGALSPDPMAYGAARYFGYGAPSLYPVSAQVHSHPADLQNRRAFPPAEAPYWSDPYAAAPARWGFPPPPPPAAPPSPPAGGGREAARKKLLAIFNGRLVDRAMEMFPGEMDPQVLVAEIILLQSQDRAGR